LITAPFLPLFINVESGFSPDSAWIEVVEREKMNKKWRICLFINIK